MGLQDRDYNRSSSGDASLFYRVFMGDFTVGHFAGIRIRLHASLALLIAFRLLFSGENWQVALTSSVILFVIVLLHEFGHCFAARSVGGRGDDILLWPLGGLAFISTPRRPWPSFVGTAGGPLVNVVICVVCLGILRLIEGSWVIGNPLAPFLGVSDGGWAQMSSTFAYYLWWIYSTSLMLLLFNLLPIFPLDGGRILQSALWARLGFYRATDIACIVGMIGSGIGIVVSLGSLWMLFLWGSCFFYCYQMRNNLTALAADAWEEERYVGGTYNDAPRRKAALPRLRLIRGGGRETKPRDDRFTLRDLNPIRWWKRRQERKQFEKLVGGD